MSVASTTGAGFTGAFRVLDCASRSLDLSQARVMGILNVTPDSFSDGGLHTDIESAVAHGLRMAEQGAAVIDVGGQSTRPGARPVGVEEELRRVVPVIEALSARLSVPISVDSSRPEVMRAAVRAGAGMINDVRALRERGALRTAAELRVPVCLMHMRGRPRDMQDRPRYRDVAAEVRAFLQRRVEACEAAGIERGRVLLDPGFGFGKTLSHNLQLLRELPGLAALGMPVLVGLSRKSMIGAILGRGEARDRMIGSVTLGALAVWQGARLLRVHDVKETVEAVRICAAVREPDQDQGA